MTWSTFLFWLATAVLGAAIVKLFDLGANKYIEHQTRTKNKAEILLAHINDYGKFADLYGFVARYSKTAKRDEAGNLLLDASGNMMMEDKSFEPETRFNDALMAMKGTDFDTAITNKIIEIRLASAQANDIALELDPSGALKKTVDGLILKDSMDNRSYFRK